MASDKSNDTKSDKDLGPRGLKGDDPTVGYALAKSEWYAIQRWMDVVRNLPANDPALRTYLTMSLSDSTAGFEGMLPVFSKLRDREVTWSDEVYPQIVTTASEVVAYARKVPIFYRPLAELAAKIVAKGSSIQPGDVDVQHFGEILDRLATLADGYSNNVAAVADKVTKLVQDLGGDRGDIAGLITTYKSDHDLSQETINNLQDEEDDYKAALKKAHKEYEHDVLVASTTPTYSWVPYVGPVAAGTVAGIYGKKAEKERKKIKRLEASISKLEHEIKVDKHILSLFSQATESLTTLNTTLGSALQALQHVQGVWSAFRDDMREIITTLDSEIRSGDVPFFMKQFGIDDAISEWKHVGDAADAWRVNAFIDTSIASAAA